MEARRLGIKGRTRVGALLAALAGLSLLAAPAVAQAAMASAGEVFGLGSNSFGQLGSEGFKSTATPTAVTFPGEVGVVTRLAAGQQHSLAITSSGQLYGFGYNASGGLGDPSLQNHATPAPIALPAGTGAPAAVSAGKDFSLVLTSSGELVSFGLNDVGQLGRVTAESFDPHPTVVSLPGAVGPVVTMAAARHHSLAVTSSGQLFSFGGNTYGELGRTPVTTTVATPGLVAIPPEAGGVTQVAGGDFFSLALTAGGQVYSFGEDKVGQLGQGESETLFTAEPDAVPGLVKFPAGAGPIVQIAAGFQHALALTAGGQLYGWGLGFDGELGGGAPIHTPISAPIQIAVPAGAGRIVKVATDAGVSLIVTASGQVFGWGQSSAGELGNTNEVNESPVALTLPEGATVDTVSSSCCAAHTLLLVADLGIAGGALPAARVGAPYTASLAASGGTPPYSYSLAGLPQGLSLDPSTGGISGAPALPGSFGLQATASDSFGVSASASLSLGVEAPTRVTELGPPIKGVPSPSALRALLLGVKGTTASVRVTCTGPAGGKCTFTLKLTVTELFRHHKLVGLTARSKVTRKVVVLGSTTVVVGAGQSRVVHVSLNSTGKRLLTKRHVLKVRLQLSKLPSGQSASGLPVVVTFKAPHHRKHHH